MPRIDFTPEPTSSQAAATSKDAYLRAALPQIPRLLGMLDRNPYRHTYGCFDRQFWHYRTACFPSEMYQEGVLPLALVYAREFPGNRWFANPQLRQWIVAALQFSARSCHADGSCDDYYPFERALGAAVFSFAAATEACRLMEFNAGDSADDEVLHWLRLRARWISRNGESGTLANHHVLAALGLARLADFCGDESGGNEFGRAAGVKLRETLNMQDAEGWFCEYGGADPGYQTVTIDCLAKIRTLMLGNASLAKTLEQEGVTQIVLDAALCSAVHFTQHFLHPDGSYSGAYGSRGTLHFYPHGFELLARDDFAAAETAARMAAAFRRAVAHDKIGHFDDDRMFVHRLGNLLEAYGDASTSAERESPDRPQELSAEQQIKEFPHAGLLVVRSDTAHAVISAARGGVFSHSDRKTEALLGDAGLILELADGRIAVSQSHDLANQASLERQADGEAEFTTYTVRTPLHFTRFETVSPLKQSILHCGMVSVGRFCRTLVRRVLQQRVITGRRPAPLVLTRRFEFTWSSEGGHAVRVTDRIKLTAPKVTVRRMSYGVGFEAAYVAASGVYRDDQLQPWLELDAELAELNADRCVEIVREFPGGAIINPHSLLTTSAGQQSHRKPVRSAA